MSEVDNNKLLQLSDDAILVIREIIQFSLLTGTNIVDHLRNIRLDVMTREEGHSLLIPNKEYIDAYNRMVESFTEQAEQAQQETETETE